MKDIILSLCAGIALGIAIGVLSSIRIFYRVGIPGNNASAPIRKKDRKLKPIINDDQAYMKKQAEWVDRG